MESLADFFANVCRDFSRHVVLRVLMAWRKAYLALKRFWSWTADYTGRLAEIIKGFRVAVLFIIVFYPFWSYPLWLYAARSLGSPFNIVIYILFWIQILTIAILAGRE